jgi:iron complex transport system substrate-binding protein
MGLNKIGQSSLGQQKMTNHSSMQIVSLLPSTTEIVCALGLKKNLVGRSHECDFPKGIDQLPVCTAAKIDSSRSSLEIDQQVKRILEQGVSIYQVHAELLKKLQPDIILTQAQCEVCAVSLKEVEEAVCGWLESPVQIVSCSPMGLADVWSDIHNVAMACDVPDKGKQVVESLMNRVSRIAEQTCDIAEKPRVACIEWLDPLMAAGNWIPELVTLAGGINLFGTAAQHSPWLSWEELLDADPDILVILPCGFGLERCRTEMAVLVNHPAWQQLRVVQNRQVFITDGNQYFNRPGPRLVESLEIMTELFYPGLFNFGHQNQAWQVFETNNLIRMK